MATQTPTPSEWAQTQREGWLTQLYGVQDESSTRKLDRNTIQSQLLEILENLLAGHVSPADSASKTSTLVTEQTDIGRPVMNLGGLVSNAMQTFSDIKILQRLVDYEINLASLPDVVNLTGHDQTFDEGGGQIQTIRPNQLLAIQGQTLWKDLPGFSLNLTESFQGPELYLAHNQSTDNSKQSWTNINTFVALLARDHRAQKLPATKGVSKLGLRTLAMATEHSSESRLGRNEELHVPAARKWLELAAGEIERLCQKGEESFDMGDLWRDQGGSEICDENRLRYWRERLNK